MARNFRGQILSSKNFTLEIVNHTYCGVMLLVSTCLDFVSVVNLQLEVGGASTAWRSHDP